MAFDLERFYRVLSFSALQRACALRRAGENVRNGASCAGKVWPMDELHPERTELRVPYRDIDMHGRMHTAAYIEHAEEARQRLAGSDNREEYLKGLKDLMDSAMKTLRSRARKISARRKKHATALADEPFREGALLQEAH